MDAEVAAGATFDSDELSNPFSSDDSLSLADSSEPGEDDDPASESDDEPLLATRRGRNTNNAQDSAAKGKATRAASTRGVGFSEAPTLPSFLSGATENSEASEPGSLPDSTADSDILSNLHELSRITEQRRGFRRSGNNARVKRERNRLEHHHPELSKMWDDLEKMPILKAGMAQQPQSISRRLKPFQLEGLAWMKEMEKTEWKGGLLGDEMGLGKTIQAVSLIMSDYPAKQPSLVLVPPVALMQWQSEIKAYTDGTLKTFVFHGTNQKTKGITVKELKKYDVLMMSYNSLESMYRKQERGFKRKNGIHKEKSVIHSIHFHRIILDEAHCIKTRTTMTAKACFALKTDFRWCLTGTPLQNRIGEFFSLIRFLNIKPFASYLCKQCPCSSLEWNMKDDNRCRSCNHAGMQHVSVFNQELLNPIQKFGNLGPGRQAFRKLRLMTERIMLRRLKKDHTDAMELPVKEIYVDRQFFGEEENDFANSIMTNGQRKFDTYVAQGVLLNNYANIFGLIMQMRQVADHPDLLLKKHAEGGQNVLVCCICDEPAEDTVRSRCKHDFCRACVASYVRSTDEPDCPRCHIPLSIDLEQPEIEQDESLVKKNSIINRIKMENWTSSSKIELLVHELHKLRSDNASHKSIIFSQFTTMLQLIEWRLRRAGITTVMLDGSMTPAQRQASIEHFMTKVDVECFLVSLKAGGVALNLTEASRVFIVDPWWNPAAEWQSADRCHRIGQTRPCTITRLCIEDSVESRMVLIQEKKTSMIHSTVNGDDKAMESLTPEDMQFLFRGS
ncbi:type III restriction enzyme, res subunit [Hirsutella rhossiliensis]|uniref:Type III restriction enzyme, res subunit domain-containing protein n=1 Tax=Hirsutella rhossiliensis TaxID=111463 RepID=A0A9P8N711_9HYPO|nr:type III restriction enzyme, res subunit domain-containing protein [Hirsutella rhossiliensis]KAH0967929.1 type III restriction enzyme, res subunit domain-containing protein [Hirsutella rhossiliensis]